MSLGPVPPWPSHITSWGLTHLTCIMRTQGWGVCKMPLRVHDSSIIIRFMYKEYMYECVCLCLCRVHLPKRKRLRVQVAMSMMFNLKGEIEGNVICWATPGTLGHF